MSETAQLMTAEARRSMRCVGADDIDIRVIDNRDIAAVPRGMSFFVFRPGRAAPEMNSCQGKPHQRSAPRTSARISRACSLAIAEPLLTAQHPRQLVHTFLIRGGRRRMTVRFPWISLRTVKWDRPAGYLGRVGDARRTCFSFPKAPSLPNDVRSAPPSHIHLVEMRVGTRSTRARIGLGAARATARLQGDSAPMASAARPG